MSENYWTTSVSLARSSEEIRRLLSSFDCDMCSITENWKGGTILVQFVYKGFPVSFTVDVGRIAEVRLASEPWNRKRRMSKDAYEKMIRERAGMVSMRVLCYHLKAALVAVEYGLVTFESVFLSHFLTKSGETIGEALLPRLHDAIANPGRLLGAGK